jgi:Trk-type K+ transport system membrane component
MSKSLAQQAAENKLSLWISVSLMWGTVFFITSIFMLKLAGSVAFSPDWSDSLKAYLFYAVMIVIVALGGYGFNKLYDPTGEKRAKRQAEVKAGMKEQVFVSFAGSIATGFSFCLLTALSFLCAKWVMHVSAEFSLQQVLVASIYNIGAGLGGSLFTGLIFVALKAMGKFPTEQSA